MKTLRHLCAAVVLTLALTPAALAGNMHTTVIEQPPPSADGQMSTPVAGQIQTGVDGQIETTVTGQMTTFNSAASPADPVTHLALSLLQSVLSLL